jgi:2-amino-4-hydroxy-6-hydroxymethyldihydropteridine diphosphokinase
VAGSVRGYIGLGSNVGDSRATLTEAVLALAALPGARLAGVSRLYRTAPVGVTDQPDFLNAVVALDISATLGGNSLSGAVTGAMSGAVTGATELLVRLKDLERAFGRRRRRRWGPRELDLDLLLYGDSRFAVGRPPAGAPLSASTEPAAATRLLEVPHPSLADRLFVLAPLADLAPDLVPPGWTESVGQAAARRAIVERDAVEVIASWDPARRAWS